MAHLLDNEFSSYELTTEEMTQGSILTLTQKQVIQNDIAISAAEKLNLEYDPNNPNVFMQQEAKLAGQIQALKYRLDCSDAAEIELQYRAENPEV
jgi:hypothetical protein